MNEAQTLVAPVHAQRSNLNLRQPVLDEIGVSDTAQDSIVKKTFQEESHSADFPAVRSRRKKDQSGCGPVHRDIGNSSEESGMDLTKM